MGKGICKHCNGPIWTCKTRYGEVTEHVHAYRIWNIWPFGYIIQNIKAEIKSPSGLCFTPE